VDGHLDGGKDRFQQLLCWPPSEGLRCHSNPIGIAGSKGRDQRKAASRDSRRCGLSPRRVSVGDYDFVKGCAERIWGVEIVFWKVAMKPGMPVVFGTVQGNLSLVFLEIRSFMVSFETIRQTIASKDDGPPPALPACDRSILKEDIQKRPGSGIS